MTVAVIGGAGFIGSNLCADLTADGRRVICVDNFLTGRKENIAALMERDNFTFIEADATKDLDIKADYFFHLASPASPVDYRRLPLETLMVNSLGTKNVLEAVLKNGAKLVMASTSEVYGDPKIPVQIESYWGHVNPIGPRSCYDEAKRFAEALIMAYKRLHGINFVIVRIFNTYGPRMRLNDGRVVPNFITQALAGRPLTVYGDGRQTRSLCYVDDLTAGLRAAMFSDVSGEVINLGNPRELTVLELAENIRDLCGSKSETVFQPLPPDDPKRRRPDITKAKKMLAWRPQVSLEAGLTKTIAWFKEELS